MLILMRNAKKPIGLTKLFNYIFSSPISVLLSYYIHLLKTARASVCNYAFCVALSRAKLSQDMLQFTVHTLTHIYELRQRTYNLHKHTVT